MKEYRTKKHNPECHVSVQITGSDKFFEDAKRVRGSYGRVNDRGCKYQNTYHKITFADFDHELEQVDRDQYKDCKLKYDNGQICRRCHSCRIYQLCRARKDPSAYAVWCSCVQIHCFSIRDCTHSDNEFQDISAFIDCYCTE